MSNTAYNIYVRYPDASSDLRWSQIWIDSYPDFGTAQLAMESFDPYKLGEEKMLAMTVNKDGGVYGKHEIVMVFGKAVNGKLCFICDDYYVGDQSWVPELMERRSTFGYWQHVTNPLELEGALLFHGNRRIPRKQRVLMACKINKDILIRVCKDLMVDDEYANECLHLPDRQIDSIENKDIHDKKLHTNPVRFKKISLLNNRIYDALDNSQLSLELSE